jgi:hypothetical protein
MSLPASFFLPQEEGKLGISSKTLLIYKREGGIA